MDKREIAEQKLHILDEDIIRPTPVTPMSFTYVSLFQALQELHFQGEYDLVIGICDAWRQAKRQKSENQKVDIEGNDPRQPVCKRQERLRRDTSFLEN